MPNTREKLIDLIDEALYSHSWDFGDNPNEEAMADILIANGVTVQKWISVKDRLPDCADTVIAVDRCGIMSTAYYVGYWHGGGDLDEYAVTHWMPLPQPPKGE